MKIGEIDTYLQGLDREVLQKELEQFRMDQRTGVMKLVQKYERKITAFQLQQQEWMNKVEFDRHFHENQWILVGVDEVGRGPLAGPVVAAAVILPYDTQLLGLKDSKKLSEAKREELFITIQKTAKAIGIGIVEPDRIDKINILQATFEAMRQALCQLKIPYEKIAVDGDKRIPHIQEEQYAIIGGDDKSGSIAAASVIAKVTRDRLMKDYAKDYPGYDWESNKGYGSNKHYEGIRSLGITPLHRKSFLKNEGIF